MRYLTSAIRQYMAGMRTSPGCLRKELYGFAIIAKRTLLVAYLSRDNDVAPLRVLFLLNRNS